MPDEKFLTSVEQVWREALNSILPPPRLTISEWADANRFMDNMSPIPGPWRTSNTPYLREIMDALTPFAQNERVIVMKSVQVGATEVLLNTCGYLMHYAPAPTMLIQPTVNMAERFSKQRLDPLIENTPVLRDRVKDPRSRDSGNTMLMKEFAGGVLILTGTNSAVGLRSLPAKYVLCDEVDGWEGDVDGEGDPFELAYNRTAAFGSQRKVLAISTPSIKGLSRIERLYELSDQRLFWVPCETCGEYQVLVWQQVKWTTPADAHYECAHCGAHWHDAMRHRSIRRGEWRASATSQDGKTVGFHINGLMTPWGQLSAIVEKFLAAKSEQSSLKVFVNQTLGEVWFDRGDAPNWEVVKSRSEDYGLGTIQLGSLILTAGVDVQRDRLELSVYGWGRGKQSWLVNHFAIPGKPEQAETWQALDAALAQTYRHPGGAQLTVQKLGIDSGYAAQEVYSWARTKSPALVMVIKGQDSGAALVGIAQAVDVRADGRRARRGVKVWPCNVSMAKSELYGWLRLTHEGDGYPPGWVHMPRMEDEFYQQLTAEQYVTRIVKGYRKGEWVKTRERNEALDCRNYARFAANAVGLDRFGDQHWAALERQLGIDTERKAHVPMPEPAPERAPFRQQAPPPLPMGARIDRGGGWLDRTRGGWLR